MTCNPAYVSSAPINVITFIIKNSIKGKICIEQVTLDQLTAPKTVRNSFLFVRKNRDITFGVDLVENLVMAHQKRKLTLRI